MQDICGRVGDAMSKRVCGLERQAVGIAGLDEVGRGALAGPVMAAGVVFLSERPFDFLHQVRDSKQLLPAKRAALAACLREHPCDIAFAIGSASVEEIDTLNILNASLLAMKRAWEQLPTQAITVTLVDGTHVPSLHAPCQAVINGDAHHMVIAAASIIAKVERDMLMTELACRYPAFEWERNKGYGTQAHRRAICTHGISPHHRRSWNLTGNSSSESFSSIQGLTLCPLAK